MFAVLNHRSEQGPHYDPARSPQKEGHVPPDKKDRQNLLTERRFVLARHQSANDGLGRAQNGCYAISATRRLRCWRTTSGALPADSRPGILTSTRESLPSSLSRWMRSFTCSRPARTSKRVYPGTNADEAATHARVTAPTTV